MFTDFQQSVWEALKTIPRGKVTTYGEIARYLGRPRAARAVGSAVGKNPNAPEVPCHRVVPSSGLVGNYSGPGGRDGKIKLLKEEGVVFERGKVGEFYRF
ncbi:MGMT family protein [Candidatus Gracilibacteria bacterium]|nr:MGMT family protein [Candidatus Gracilibacteria bacterium]